MRTLHAEAPTFEAADDAVSPTAVEDFNLRADGLSRLAGAAGGALYPLIGTDQRTFDRILQELSGYYLLAFEPAAGERDGRPHRISVSVRMPRVMVRARAAFDTPADTDTVHSKEERLVRGRSWCGRDERRPAQQRWPIAFETDLQPGRYLLRAAAIERTGRSGSVEQRVDLRRP